MSNTKEHKHTNRLIHELSPYLLQHAHNPVDWYPWSKEAIDKARLEDKPIFISIGYAACHWCHVLSHESFEDENIAALMNDLFVNIKVDREERPDLDSIYMDAVQAMTGSGGWPMSVFLTPEGEPFYGGTYYPPEPRYGMPSFRQVLLSVADAWQKRRDQVNGQAQRLTDALRRSAVIAAGEGELTTSILDEAITQLNQYFDEQNGGFGSQPKFPQPMTLDFCMRQYKRTGDLDALYMAEHTLTQMANGGIYDQLGGGFHRYSVDAIWLTPHFEKMLYDNAQLLRSYLQAWQISQSVVSSQKSGLVTRDSGLMTNDSGLFYRRIIEETVAYVLREMTSPEGGFYSTQDADSEGHEGKFFVWTPDEIWQIIGDQHQSALVETYYGVSTRGNFEGKNILSITKSLDNVAQRYRTTHEVVEAAINSARQKLFDAREQRIKPARDEKILVEWNGLMIHALAEISQSFNLPTALDAAINAANFILTHMSQPDGKLYRSYKSNGTQINGDKQGLENVANSQSAILNAYLEDYASFARSLVALYEATFDLRWLAEASRLTKIMFEQFHDPIHGGFFQTGTSHEQLVVRRKDYIDNAVPSGNSLAAELLLRLAVLVGNDSYRKEAQRIIATMKDAAARQPTGFGRMLCALDTLLAPSQEVAIVGEPADPATQALLAEVHRRFLPNTVVALKKPAEDSMLPLLAGRTLVDGKSAAYVCENYACKLPVTNAQELGRLL
ncbi:MAG: thioredoxin domain-containing protein [Caldilineaceae bacterium]